MRSGIDDVPRSDEPADQGAAEVAAEVAALRAAASDLLGRHWGDAATWARPDAERRLAVVARRGREQGWWDLGEVDDPRYLLAVAGELGAHGCPLPVVDAHVALRVVPDAEGVVVAAGPSSWVASHERPRHLLVLDPAGARLGEVVTAEQVGTLVPGGAWRLETGTSRRLDLAPAELERARTVLRAGVATRAVEAAGRAHALAVEHARTRRQFGRPVGAFGAVQQRTASAHIELTAARALLDEAAQALAHGGSDAAQAGALAARFAGAAAVDVLAAAQHTLGAVGYFDEHQVAWLFRLVHADAARLRAGDLADHGEIASWLVDDGRRLPVLEMGERAETFREQVRALLAAHRRDDGVVDPEGLRADMAERRLFSLGWPGSAGGRPASVEEQVVLHEELKYAGGPVDRAMSATMLIGHSLLRHGTAEQQASFLPLVREGRLAFCLGYSEPEAGSDLASLRTRAVRDGDHWVVDGQKSWTTRGHTASHVWLAVRTDPDARPRHAGITILLVPMDSPGISVQQHTALSGEVSCTVFYDAVRVPDACRVGEVGGGWRVITDALAAERVVMGGVAAVLRRRLDDVVDRLRAGGPVDAVRRDLLAHLATRLQAARVLVLAATRGMEGAEARVAGPMAAVLAGDLAEELARGCVDLLGAPALTDGDDVEALLRLAPMFVIGGGTNDVQRGLVARALGLPKE